MHPIGWVMGLYGQARMQQRQREPLRCSLFGHKPLAVGGDWICQRRGCWAWLP